MRLFIFYFFITIFGTLGIFSNMKISVRHYDSRYFIFFTPCYVSPFLDRYDTITKAVGYIVNRYRKRQRNTETFLHDILFVIPNTAMHMGI